MPTKSASIAAHHNIDSNVVRVQLFITDEADSNFHSNSLISGEIQLFNVFNLPKTGLQQIPLEKVVFDKNSANQDNFFNIFFVNPAINTNLEARATLEIAGQGEIKAATMVLNEAGTFSNTPQHSVIGNAVNRSWHLDPEKERDEPFQDTAPHTPIELGENQTVVIEENVVNSLNVDIKFEELAEKKSAKILEGQLVYLGGGDRLLPRAGILVAQSIDTPGWELGTSTFVEQGSPQLLPNNNYILASAGNLPQEYTMDSPGIKTINSSLLKLQGEGFEAKAWELKLNGASPSGISPFHTASVGLANPLPFDITKPIALSLLAGLEKGTPDSDITEVKLILRFFDFADRELPSVVKVLDPADLFNARPLRPFSIQAKPPYPATAEKFTWRLEMGSLEQGDFITVRTALPSVTNTPFATSQVLTGQTRSPDNLSYAPATPFSLEEGAAIFNLAIGFEGAPTEDKYIFDTRDSATLAKGAALRVDSTGTLTFLIADETSTVSVSTPSPIPWVSGKVSEVVVEWSSINNTLYRISVDGTVLLEDTSTAFPSGMEGLEITSIQLGSNAQVQEHLDSEFIRSIFLKRPR